MPRPSPEHTTGQPSLEDLMARYLAGDENSFAALYNAAAPRLISMLTRRTKDSTLAEDAVQLTFLKLHRKRDQYRRGAPVLPWLHVIAKRTLMDEARGLRARREVLSDDGELRPVQSSVDILKLERRSRLRSALDQLPEQYRYAIELTKLEGFSGLEAADILNTTAAAIKQRVHRGYAMLRDLLRPDERTPTLA